MLVAFQLWDISTVARVTSLLVKKYLNGKLGMKDRRKGGRERAREEEKKERREGMKEEERKGGRSAGRREEVRGGKEEERKGRE